MHGAHPLPLCLPLTDTQGWTGTAKRQKGIFVCPPVNCGLVSKIIHRPLRIVGPPGKVLYARLPVQACAETHRAWPCGESTVVMFMSVLNYILLLKICILMLSPLFCAFFSLCAADFNNGVSDCHSKTLDQVTSSFRWFTGWTEVAHVNMELLCQTCIISLLSMIQFS